MMRPQCILLSVVFAASTAYAGPSRNLPSAQQMQAIHACAAKQGVGLPPAPGASTEQPATHLTDAQKKIVDDCFRESGLAPPARHDDPVDDGEGGMPPDRLGPPPG